ncbi:COP9 signalosome complex subunit 7b-like isoform X2 [Oopsacas minuta]|uniref:COP9 signalosome complex subunit 7b-like isoform X2 n=1 Tax=Oopsacas minuta TaxID=111878 RepID=A0AAV7JP43_9METZ|nr:COP9 signalosome complex subunit 7b-like isoform X2 [Oopsacas minuta]
MSELGNTPLQPFLLLCQTAQGETAVEVIKQCVEAPNVFIFVELLQMPNIQALNATPHEKYVKLLRLFSFGTLPDYRAAPALFPELTERMLSKLKLLTLVSLASESKRLEYSSVMELLEIGNMRALEDTVIEAIYAGIIRGKLDQEKQVFEVIFSMGRDIDMDVTNALDPLIDKLDKWCDNCQTILSSLDKQATAANQCKEKHNEQKKALENEIESIRSTLKVAEMEEAPVGHIATHTTIQSGKGLRGKAAIGGKNY